MRVAARHEVTSRWPRCSFWHELTSFWPALTSRDCLTRSTRKGRHLPTNSKYPDCYIADTGLTAKTWVNPSCQSDPLKKQAGRGCIAPLRS